MTEPFPAVTPVPTLLLIEARMTFLTVLNEPAPATATPTPTPPPPPTANGPADRERLDRRVLGRRKDHGARGRRDGRLIDKGLDRVCDVVGGERDTERHPDAALRRRRQSQPPRRRHWP